MNVFHFQESPSQSNAEAAFGALQTFYESLAGGILSTGWGVRRMVATGESPNVAGYEKPFNINGTATGTNLPNDCALVISWRTSGAGRTARGRTYLAGLPVNMITGSGVVHATVLPGKVGSIVASAKALIDNPATTLTVYSRKLGIHREVTHGYVNDEIDTQRRRGRDTPTIRTSFLGSNFV